MCFTLVEGRLAGRTGREKMRQFMKEVGTGSDQELKKLVMSSKHQMTPTQTSTTSLELTFDSQRKRLQTGKVRCA